MRLHLHWSRYRRTIGRTYRWHTCRCGAQRVEWYCDGACEYASGWGTRSAVERQLRDAMELQA